MKTPIHIGLIAASPATIGGHSVQARTLAAEFRADGYVVSYIPIDVRLPRGVRWIRRLRYVRTIVNEVLYLLTLQRLLRCDIVHVFSASYWSFLLGPVPAILVAKLFRKSVIVHYHSGEADDHLSRWRLSVRPMLRMVDAIVVPSHYLEKVFASHGYRTRVIPNAIESSEFQFRQRDRLQPRLLSTRNLETHYGVDVLIRGFMQVKQRFPGATLTIVGQGSQERALRLLVEQLGVSGVRFAGPVDPSAMAAVYDAADIFVNASVIDNQPVSILEAFASGLPVVSTPTGDIASMLAHGDAGLLVDVNDPAALAAAVTSLLEDDTLAIRVSRFGRKQLAAYAPAAVCEQWRSLYDELQSVVPCDQEVLANGV